LARVRSYGLGLIRRILVKERGQVAFSQWIGDIFKELAQCNNLLKGKSLHFILQDLALKKAGG